MQKYIPLPFEINLRSAGFIFDLGSLLEALCEVHDRRDARGLRDALVTLLVFSLLAKLAGENHLRGMAQWVKRWQDLLANLLAVAEPQAPHATTYNRALSRALDIEGFEQVASQCFAQPPQVGQSLVLALDGKILRGTIPAGQTRGVYLFAAYLPDEGWVAMQVAIDLQENEIPAAGRVLKTFDLRDKIITRDARLAQRELSLQIVQAGGDDV